MRSASLTSLPHVWTSECCSHGPTFVRWQTTPLDGRDESNNTAATLAFARFEFSRGCSLRRARFAARGRRQCASHRGNHLLRPVPSERPVIRKHNHASRSSSPHHHFCRGPLYGTGFVSPACAKTGTVLSRRSDRRDPPYSCRDGGAVEDGARGSCDFSKRHD